MPQRLNSRYRLYAVCAVSVIFTGCATVYEGKYDWSQGWREAEVVEVSMASMMERPRFYKCVRDASPQQFAAVQFVVVTYRNQRSRTTRQAIPLQPDQSFSRGDLVYVKADDCNTPVVRRHGTAMRVSS